MPSDRCDGSQYEAIRPVAEKLGVTRTLIRTHDIPTTADHLLLTVGATGPLQQPAPRHHALPTIGKNPLISARRSNTTCPMHISPFSSLHLLVNLVPQFLIGSSRVGRREETRHAREVRGEKTL